MPLDPDEPQVQLKVLIPMNASFSQVKEKIASVMQCKASNVSVSDYEEDFADIVADRFRPMERWRLQLVERLGP